MQGGSAHALIFSCALWSGIWPGINARRLAGTIWDWMVIKKSNFGGEKNPEGMPKRRHWLGGRVYPL